MVAAPAIGRPVTAQLGGRGSPYVGAQATSGLGHRALRGQTRRQRGSDSEARTDHRLTEARPRCGCPGRFESESLGLVPIVPSQQPPGDVTPERRDVRPREEGLLVVHGVEGATA